MSLSDDIRTALKDSGRTVYDLAFQVKVDNNSLSRFMRGQTGLSLTALDRIGQHLGLTVQRANKAGGNEAS